jgi:hypothetical protein
MHPPVQSGIDQPQGLPGRGGFFRLFELRPTIFQREGLQILAEEMAIGAIDGTAIESGYVYLGQLIAHDVSRLVPPEREFVPTWDLEQLSTPALDLANVYGYSDATRPPTDARTGKLILGNVTGSQGAIDLPRTVDGIARIPDDRDDENLLLAQLHLQFMKLHNYFVDQLTGRPDERFEEARRQVVLHYQDVVLFDYLHRVLDPDVWQHVIGRNKAKLWNPFGAEQPRTPIEFTAAALRFGHSMVRSSYQINADVALSAQDLFLFTGPGRFGGQSSLPESCIVDWRHFFIDTQGTPKKFNFSFPIDTEVSLRVPGVGLLAHKNLTTGNRSLLPDAQSIVDHIRSKHKRFSAIVGLKRLTTEQLNPKVSVGALSVGCWTTAASDLGSMRNPHSGTTFLPRLMPSTPVKDSACSAAGSWPKHCWGSCA